MDESAIEKDIAEALASHKKTRAEIIAGYIRAAKRFDDLVKRGLAEKRGYKLMPIDRMRNLSFQTIDTRPD